MYISDYIKNSTNSELIGFVKDLKNSEKNVSDIFKFSKNFRYLLNEYREHKEININDFIAVLDYELKNEILERIHKNKIIIY